MKRKGCNHAAACLQITSGPASCSLAVPCIVVPRSGLCQEGVQAYGGSYSSVTSSGNIRNEIGVMQFPCNEIAMSDGFVQKHPNRLRISMLR